MRKLGASAPTLPLPLNPMLNLIIQKISVSKNIYNKILIKMYNTITTSVTYLCYHIS